MRDGRLGSLRQRDPDAISLADPLRPQRVREPVRVVGELAEGDAPGDLASVRDHDRDRVARVALADVDAQVHLRRHLPAEALVELLVRHAQRRSKQREIDLRRPHELRDLDRLDVPVRAGSHRAVVDGGDPRRVEHRAVGDEPHAGERQLLPGHVAVRLAERDDEAVLGVDPVGAPRDLQVEVDRATGVRRDRLEQRPELGLCLLHRVPRRPAARADEAALDRVAVVEVAAVHLPEEVRLRADPLVLDRRQLLVAGADRLDHPGGDEIWIWRAGRGHQLVGDGAVAADRDLERRATDVRNRKGRGAELADDAHVRREAVLAEEVRQVLTAPKG